ncbi:MAG: thioredoxin domain-containing protein, partial [Bauldia sp.]
RNWAFVGDPQTALFNLVRQAGFTRESFEACLKNQSILDGVNEVKNRGTQLGVDATPTFFFNGAKKAGEQSIEDIDGLLAN